MKKDATPKTQRGSSERHPMKKEATPKMQRGSSKRPPIKKEQTPKMQRGSSKRPPMKKRQSNNRHLIEASSSNLTLEGKGDTFWFSQ
jgi:hypothetical protein